MSGLSGYDSEVVGFDNVSEHKRPSTTTSAQTTEFSELGNSTQSYTSREVGCMAYPEDLNYVPKDQTAGLNAFLKRVVPAVMEQLDQNDREFVTYSSDSDEEDEITAKLLQEILIKDASGSGDHGTAILGVTWSSAGNSIAVSIGALQHETWCQNSGVIKIFTYKRSDEKFLHSFDVTDKNCVSVLKYHPTVAALLAYGTASGEVVLCNLAGGNMDEGVQLTSPSGCHGSRRVSTLKWADTSLVNTFLTMQIQSKGRRRGAADQVLFSAGEDGTLNAWRVNANLQVFENIICYNINSSQNLAPDITCFDFINNYPLRPADEKTPEVFVVGTKTGQLFLCNIKGQGVDPVFEVLESHSTCILDVAFSEQRPGIFVSISMDSELRVYDVNQPSPLKILCLDCSISTMSWLSPPTVVVGLCNAQESLRVYNVNSGKMVPVAGISGTDCGGGGGGSDVTCLAVNMFGSCRIAAGTESGGVRIWEFPARRLYTTDDDLDF